MKILNTLAATAVLLLSAFAVNAKVWRVNNNLGASADFTNFNTAVTSASVLSGDTLYIEGSATNYGGTTITKQLTIIGTGYFLDPANGTIPGNPGLQYNTQSSKVGTIAIGAGSAGSKFTGLDQVGFNGSSMFTNITIEKCWVGGIVLPNAANSSLTIRKCYVSGAITCNSGSLTNFTCENNIIASFWAAPNMPNLSGSNNIFRNNSYSFTDIVSVQTILANCYVANNIFHNGNGTPVSFTNCNIKNNLFSQNQSLPPSATNNLVNVVMTTVYVGGTTGSFDSRVMLKAGSPAIAAGLTVGAVTTPDCGAYGATDPYKLSGIPAIPAIYSITAPTSIPSGTNSMNVTFSTRNNN